MIDLCIDLGDEAVNYLLTLVLYQQGKRVAAQYTRHPEEDCRLSLVQMWEDQLFEERIVLGLNKLVGVLCHELGVQDDDGIDTARVGGAVRSPLVVPLDGELSAAQGAAEGRR